jgi:DNA-binding transcriptional MerR regulator
MPERSHLSIGEVLSLLRDEFPDVTISKIRFLESQGLVDPERTPSGYRKFYEHDVDRLRWILRQQRENFLPLKVIRGRLSAHGEADESGAAFDAAVESAPAGASGHDLDGDRSQPSQPSLLGDDEPGETPAAAAATASTGSTGETGGGAPAEPAAPALRDHAGRSSAPGPASDAGLSAEPGATVPAGRRDQETDGSEQTGATDAGTGSRMVTAAAAPGAGATPAMSRSGATTSVGTDRSGSGPGASDAAPRRQAEDITASHPAAGSRRLAVERGGPPLSGAGPYPAEPASAPPVRRSAGRTAPPDPRAGGSAPANAGQPASAAASPSGRGGTWGEAGTGPAGDDEENFSIEELAAATGATIALVRDLQQYGLILVHAVVAGTPYFDAGALEVVRASARFARHGVEPRHLRAWRNSADREVGLYEQVIMPLLRQRNPDARRQASATLSELTGLGSDLRNALIDQAVRRIH